MSAFNRVSALVFCIAISFVGTSAASELSGQSQDPSPERSGPVLAHRPVPVVRVTEGKVKLDVVVVDGEDEPVSGLSQGDFTLLDNKLPQKIATFSPFASTDDKPKPPVEIILLIDAVNTSHQEVADTRQQVEKFLRQDNGHLPHPVSIAWMSSSGVKLQNQASIDGNALATALEQNDIAKPTVGPADEAYGDLQRFQISMLSLTSLMANAGKRPGRKLLIWLSPGWPVVDANSSFSAKDQQRFLDSIVRISTGLRDARITLYSIDPRDLATAVGGDTSHDQRHLDGAETIKQYDAGNLALPMLAVQSGGLALKSNGGLLGQINTCVADSDAFYSLSFDPSQPGEGDEYHPLEVKIGKPGLTARTNTGYYSRP